MIKQAVLLAAGSGSRLLPYTKDSPKCMVKVAGRAIVDTLLDALRRLEIAEIVVVTGYQAEALKGYLRRQEGFRWRFVHNERFASTNNILSLHVAQEAIEPPFLLVESDIYVEPNLLAPLHKTDQILVAPYAQEMNGTGIVMAENGNVQEMVLGAHLARPSALGGMHKTLNLYSLSEATWQVYGPALARWVQEGRLDQYYEAVLAELINTGQVAMHGADVGRENWGEVDDVEDLIALEARLLHGRCAVPSNNANSSARLI